MTISTYLSGRYSRELSDSSIFVLASLLEFSASISSFREIKIVTKLCFEVFLRRMRTSDSQNYLDGVEWRSLNFTHF
jgi:hypothetical protein